MSALDALEFRPESAGRADAPAADTRPEPGLLEQAGAAMRDQFDRSLNVQGMRKIEAYEALVDALEEQGLRKDDLMTRTEVPFLGPQPSGELDYSRVWREAQRRGLVSGSQEEFERQALTRNGEHQRDMETLARGSGLDATVAQFGGAMVGSLGDPINIVSLPVGGGGRTAAARILSEGLVNAGVEGVQAVTANPEAWAALGEEYGAGDAVRDIALAGALGMVARGGIELAPKIDAAGYRAAAPLRERFDEFFADRDLARAFSQMVPENARTPDQVAALEILTREAEIDEASPYARTIAGDEAHRARLGEAMDRNARAGLGPRGSGSLNSQILGFLRGKGYTEAQARGIAAGIHAESASNAAAVNPSSGAFGIGQWLGPRKAELFRRYGSNPSLGQQLEFLHWELQGGDHGGARVLGQADEASVLRSYVQDFMRPAAGAETSGDLARGMAALGRGGEAIGDTADTLAGLELGEDLPVIRPAALDADRPFVSSAGREVPIATFRPADIGVDAELMQFKSGGDELGVTDRLQGVQDWDPVAAGLVTVWEGADGRRLIADGHQRLGLARRIEAATGQEIGLNAFVLREADGFSARDARIVTALKNIGEGTGSAADAAKVMREAGDDFADLVERRLPPRSALVRDGKALARLSDEAFGAVINDVIPEGHAAAIGHLAPDPETHFALVELLAATDPANRRQAEAIVRQALEAGFVKETQEELFGSRDVATALFLQRARLLDKTLGELRRLKGAFGVAARNADALEGAGNRIDVAGTEAAAVDNGRALALVERLALRKGNAVNELFDEAARRLAAGEPIARVVRDLVAGIRGLELADLERADTGARDAGDGDLGSGRAGEPQGQAQQDLSPAELDELEAEVDLGPSLFDDPQGAAARAFDDDAGDGVQAAAESDWHDIRAAAEPPADIGAKLDARIAADPATARAEYEAIDNAELGLTSEGGRVINTDLARELSPEYRADRSRSQEVHEAASAFVKDLYRQRLAEDPPAGRDKEVLFTAGGTGAGKSTGLQLLEGENAGIIYDTNMNTLSSAVDKIEQALEAGWKVRILYTFRDPIEALVNGALPRAERMGRTVGLVPHVDTHVGARQVIGELAKRYAGDERVEIAAVDNSRGRGNAELVDLENLPEVPREGLHEKAEAAVRAAFERGAIGEQTLAGTLGREALGAADRRQLEPADGGQVSPLDRGAAADPNIAARQRQAAELGAAAPMRATVDQDGTMGSPLFDAADQPTFDLDDGKGARTAAEIDQEIAAEKAGLEAIRACLK